QRVRGRGLGVLGGEPYVSLALGPEGLRRGPVGTVRAEVAGLIPAGWEPPDPAEPTLASHQATRPDRGRGGGSTNPSAINSRTADSGMRTWRPTRTNRMHRSAIRLRGKRSVVPSSWATSATVGWRSIVPPRLPAITPPSRLPEARRRRRRVLGAWPR